MMHGKLAARISKTIAGLLLTCTAATVLAETGVTDKEILLGRSSSISGMAALMQVSYSQGYEAALMQVNSVGGIHGRKIRCIVMDDAFDAKRTVANITKMIDQDGVFALFSLNGTASVVAAMKVAQEKKVPIFGAITGAQSLRSTQNFNRYLFHVRAGYADEMEAIVKHAHMLEQADAVIIYQNIPFGKALLEHVTTALSKRGLKPLAAFAVENDGSGANIAARETLKLNPRSVILATAGTASIATMKALKTYNVRSQLYGSSLVGVAGLQKEIGDQVNGLIVTQVMPSPFNKSDKLVRDYQAAMQAYGVKEFNYESFEAYVNFRLFVEGLKLAGKHLTREALINAIERKKGIAVGNFSASYGPKNHDGSTYIDITMVTDKPVKFIR